MEYTAMNFFLFINNSLTFHSDKHQSGFRFKTPEKQDFQDQRQGVVGFSHCLFLSVLLVTLETMAPTTLMSLKFISPKGQVSTS